VQRLLREVQRFMANRAGPGVVAVSGGADSVALLRALRTLGLPLAVAHVNHHLRGADSNADEAFVRDLCVTLGVPCLVKTVDVAALAAGENLESTARRIRYEFFAEVAAETGASWIATGHTADDQAETVLHRIIRGTGIQGLRGIAGVRRQETGDRGQETDEPDPVLPPVICHLSPALVCPFLAVTRAEILAYLTVLNQPFREDATNIDLRFTRNRIRHELIPLLKSFNPDIVAALSHLAEHACDAHEVIEAVAADALARAERPRAGNTIILDTAALSSSRAVIRAVLRFVWDRERWPLSEMGFEAWDRAVDVACGQLSDCDFPGGIAMRHAGRVVQIGRRQ
jgi:tRNA(Ile)-lysidine synthase